MICNDRRPVCGTRSATVADRYRSYGNTQHCVCDGRRRTIWVIGKVELGSTFPTITISPTTTDFNGNAYLGWSAAIGDIPLFLLKHVSVTAQLELRKKFAAIFVPARASASGLLRLMGFLVCDCQQLYGNTCVWYLRLIDRRRSPTVTDRNRPYGNQA